MVGYGWYIKNELSYFVGGLDSLCWYIKIGTVLLCGGSR